MRREGEIIGKLEERILLMFSVGYGKNALGGGCGVDGGGGGGGLCWRYGRLLGPILLDRGLFLPANWGSGVSPVPKSEGPGATSEWFLHLGGVPVLNHFSV